jgi:hypothetical protein
MTTPKPQTTANMADVVYTPDWLAADMVAHFNPTGIVMDPCRGGGAFFDKLPEGALWCEIAQGRDFFFCEREVDWLISNPPYSIFAQWLTHSLKVADNVCYLLPVNKIFSSVPKLNQIRRFGGIKQIRHYGSGRDCGFPFGFAVAAIHIQRGYKGDIEQSHYNETTG